jgi:hypothetical protein
MLVFGQVCLGLMATILVGDGAFLAFQNKTAPATTTLTFGFLLTLLMLISKFKRFKGFGFEAEMWKQEQVKAAVLIAQLKALSFITIEQLAVISSQLGLASGGGNVSERETLLSQLEEIAAGGSLDGDELRDKIAPLYNRICYDYGWAAEWQAKNALAALQGSNYPEQKTFESAADALNEIDRIRSLIGTESELYIHRLLQILRAPEFATKIGMGQFENLSFSDQN